MKINLKEHLTLLLEMHYLIASLTKLLEKNMKVTKDVYSDIEEKVSIVLPYLLPKDKGAITIDRFTNSDLMHVWFRAATSVSFDDTNPNVLRDANGKRLFEYDFNYPLYPCDTNDTTMVTAIRKAVKNYLQA